jgi:DNA-binding NarL/FixJ family response regulator
MKKITVLLCDDHTVVRDGLRRLLEATDDIVVVGEAENGHRAVGETKKLSPDVVIMDLAMPQLNGIEAARRIRQTVPATRVLILSSYSDNQHLEQALEAGVAGYLMKETASTDLLKAIHEVYRGKSFFSPPIAHRFLRLRRRDSTSLTAPTLTDRQNEVLQLIAEGNSSKQIGELLYISIKTVEKHRQALMDKLDIHEIASLTRYAIAGGIIECEPAARLSTAL